MMMKYIQKMKGFTRSVFLASLFLSGVFFFGGPINRAQAVNVNFTYWCLVYSDHPCSSASNIWIDVDTDKGTYAPGEGITVTVNISSDDAPAAPISPMIRVGSSADLFPGTFSADEVHNAVIQTFTNVVTAPATAGPFSLTVYTGVAGYTPALSVSQQNIPLTVSGSTSTGTVNVSSNIAGANYTITGPATINGSGASASYTGKPTGTYTITWGAVSGYTAPSSSTLTLLSGGSIAFSGNYTAAPPTINVHF